MGADREKLLNALVAESEQVCLEKVAEWRARLAGVGQSQRAEVTEVSAPKVVSSSTVDTAMLSVVLSSGLHMVAAALERLEEASSEERDRVLRALLTSVGRTRVENMVLYLGELV